MVSIACFFQNVLWSFPISFYIRLAMHSLILISASGGPLGLPAPLIKDARVTLSFGGYRLCAEVEWTHSIIFTSQARTESYPEVTLGARWIQCVC